MVGTLASLRDKPRVRGSIPAQSGSFFKVETKIDWELEEFKRFCLMIKPPKNRPKVAVQVNLQDLAFRKTQLQHELNNSYNFSGIINLIYVRFIYVKILSQK